jgi:hypothetical protein
MQHATEDWVIMTGEDNYYMPVFVDHFLNSVTPQSHFVFCNMVHNWTDHQYYPIDCEPSWGKIDIGNFMVKRENGQRIRLDVKNEQADGEFVEKYLKKFPEGEVIKINKILYVHN